MPGGRHSANSFAKDAATSPLLTDLYQINMIQAYLDHDEIDTAVFEFFVRKFPPRRGFLGAVLVSHTSFL